MNVKTIALTVFYLNVNRKDKLMIAQAFADKLNSEYGFNRFRFIDICMEGDKK